MKIAHRWTTGTINCSNSERFAFHPAIQFLCFLIPPLNLATIAFSLALIRLLLRKMTAHPISNALLLNAALGTVLTAMDMLLRTGYNILALITGDACHVTVTKQVCALQYARLLTGLTIFNLSLICAGIERAVVGTQSYLRTRKRSHPERSQKTNESFFSSIDFPMNSPQENKGPSTSSDKNSTQKDYRRTQLKRNPPQQNNNTMAAFSEEFSPDTAHRTPRSWLICCSSATMPSSGSIKDSMVLATGFLVTFWMLVIVPHAIRVSRISNPAERMDFCTAQRQDLIGTHLASVIFNLVCLTVYAYASAISKHQLRHFATSQTHFTLDERSELRYNLHVTYMICPVIVLTCVGITLNAVRALAYSLSDHLDTVNAHIVNLFIFLLVNYSPLLFFSVYSYHSFRMLQIHGPSLVITLPTNATHKSLVRSNKQNNQATNTNKIGGTPAPPKPFVRTETMNDLSKNNAQKVNETATTTTNDIRFDPIRLSTAPKNPHLDSKRGGRRGRQNDCDTHFDALSALWDNSRTNTKNAVVNISVIRR